MTQQNTAHKSSLLKKILAITAIAFGGLTLLAALTSLNVGLMIMGIGLILPGAWFFLHERKAKAGTRMKRHWGIVGVTSAAMVFGGAGNAEPPEEPNKTLAAIVSTTTNTAPTSTTSAVTTSKTTTSKPTTTRKKEPSTTVTKTATVVETATATVVETVVVTQPSPKPVEPNRQPQGFVAPPPAQAPTPTPAQSSAYYSSCAEAKAAGAAPLYQGAPGYRSGLDKDGDGVACEK